MKKIFSALLTCLFLLTAMFTAVAQANKKTMKASMSASMPGAEFADARYMDVGRKQLQQFASGDIDNWKNNFAENAVYQWSSGDSIAGREAIADYWKDRRKNVVESIKTTNDIWLPIKINKPQQGPDLPGVWLLNWHMVEAKYKTGKSLTFWVHIDYHFDANDKIDRMISYVDRAPIMEATKQ